MLRGQFYLLLVKKWGNCDNENIFLFENNTEQKNGNFLRFYYLQPMIWNLPFLIEVIDYNKLITKPDNTDNFPETI